LGFLTSKPGRAAVKKSSVSVEELARLKKWYSDELKRRDAIIDDLKKTNMLLMQTALRRSAEQQKIKDSMDELRKKLAGRGADHDTFRK